MPVRTVTIFTCERCRATHEEDDNTRQPLNWTAVLLLPQPLASAEADGVERWMLCRDCSRDLRMEWKYPAEAVAVDSLV